MILGCTPVLSLFSFVQLTTALQLLKSCALTASSMIW